MGRATVNDSVAHVELPSVLARQLDYFRHWRKVTEKACNSFGEFKQKKNTNVALLFEFRGLAGDEKSVSPTTQLSSAILNLLTLKRAKNKNAKINKLDRKEDVVTVTE